MPTYILIGIITAVALAVRLYGLDFGLPSVYHPDEHWVINTPMRMGMGDLNPHFFYWPGSLLFYIVFALYGAFFIAGKLFGIFASADDFG